MSLPVFFLLLLIPLSHTSCSRSHVFRSEGEERFRVQSNECGSWSIGHGTEVWVRSASNLGSSPELFRGSDRLGEYKGFFFPETGSSIQVYNKFPVAFFRFPTGNSSLEWQHSPISNSNPLLSFEEGSNPWTLILYSSVYGRGLSQIIAMGGVGVGRTIHQWESLFPQKIGMEPSDPLLGQLHPVDRLRTVTGDFTIWYSEVRYTENLPWYLLKVNGGENRTLLLSDLVRVDERYTGNTQSFPIRIFQYYDRRDPTLQLRSFSSIRPLNFASLPSSEDFRYLVVCPVLLNGWVLLGETSSQNPLSRIQELSSRDNGLSLQLVGNPNEEVTVEFSIPSLASITCTLSPSGYANIECSDSGSFPCICF